MPLGEGPGQGTRPRPQGEGWDPVTLGSSTWVGLITLPGAPSPPAGMGSRAPGWRGFRRGSGGHTHSHMTKQGEGARRWSRGDGHFATPQGPTFYIRRKEPGGRHPSLESSPRGRTCVAAGLGTPCRWVGTTREASSQSRTAVTLPEVPLRPRMGGALMQCLGGPVSPQCVWKHEALPASKMGMETGRTCH